jgi:response regulator of citrate/malate metabolism
MIRLLLVEDDPMVMDILVRYIRAIEGFQVKAVTRNGKEALQKLSTETVDLVIADIYMSEMQGDELLEEIRKRGLPVDVIFVTAANDWEHIDHALKLGVVDYLIKPFAFERLKNTLLEYKYRFQAGQPSAAMTQEELDGILRKQPCQDEGLRKGLHKRTLEYVREFLEKQDCDLITANEISKQMGISKTTARRYLEYFESVGILELQIEYGTVGRPAFIYRKV